MSKADIRWYNTRAPHRQALARKWAKRWAAISRVNRLVFDLEYACSDHSPMVVQVPSRHNLHRSITHAHGGRFNLSGGH